MCSPGHSAEPLCSVQVQSHTVTGVRSAFSKKLSFVVFGYFFLFYHVEKKHFFPLNETRAQCISFGWKKKNKVPGRINLGVILDV